MLVILILVAGFQYGFSNPIKDLLSPDKLIRLKVTVSTKISYEVYYKDSLIIAPSTIDFILSDGTSLSSSNGFRKINTYSNRSVIVSPVPEKRINIPDHYNEMEIIFKLPFILKFRVYNDGVAYRIATSFKDSVTVRQEIAEFNFPSVHPFLFSQNFLGLFRMRV